MAGDRKGGGKRLTQGFTIVQTLGFKWVAQVSLLRPGFLQADGSPPEHPGLKSETWATHLYSSGRFSFSYEEVEATRSRVWTMRMAARNEPLNEPATLLWPPALFR